MSYTILDTPAAWVAGDGPDADIVLYTQCRLARNFADFPYTKQCSQPEKKAI
ncbi:MAG: ATP--guanido phosphotransferase, partial [Candidatus Hydrogenedentota bacterium]